MPTPSYQQLPTPKKTTTDRKYPNDTLTQNAELVADALLAASWRRGKGNVMGANRAGQDEWQKG